jgi:hypothetical protein
MSDDERPEEEDDEPTIELRSTLLGVPEGEQGVRLPPDKD